MSCFEYFQPTNYLLLTIEDGKYVIHIMGVKLSMVDYITLDIIWKFAHYLSPEASGSIA